MARTIDTAMEERGRRLKALRESRNMYQRSVATAVGVSPQAVSSWENGLTAPGRETLAALDDALGGGVLEIYGVTVSQPGELDRLREQVGELTQMVTELAGDVRTLAGEVKQLQTRPRRAAGGTS